MSIYLYNIIMMLSMLFITVYFLVSCLVLRRLWKNKDYFKLWEKIVFTIYIISAFCFMSYVWVNIMFNRL